MGENDRELLELAAKAAGLQIEFRETYDSMFRSKQDLAYLRPESDWNKRITDCRVWNPLTDDGDALRLAVQLGITIGKSVYNDRWAAQHNSLEIIIYEKGDPNAATRRAIVRAAAEIGKAMP